MWQWISDTVEAVVDFVTGGGDDEPNEPNPCDVGGCLDALDELATARNNVAHACYLINTTMVFIRAAIWVLSRSLWEYILFAVIAILLGPIGMMAAAFIIVGALVTIRVGLPAVAVFGRGLIEAFQAEVTAIANVVAECPAECQGDLEPSECSVMGESVTVPSNPVTRWLGLTRFSTRIGGD